MDVITNLGERRVQEARRTLMRETRNRLIPRGFVSAFLPCMQEKNVNSSHCRGRGRIRRAESPDDSDYSSTVQSCPLSRARSWNLGRDGRLEV
jgi:hypothetical protein